MSFANLKKSSKNSFAQLADAINKTESKQGYGDDRFWAPAVDKAGNALCVIRFLPEVDGEDSPFVRTFSHSFKTPEGKWYIENCRTTIGGQCMVCSENSKLYNSGIESDKKIAQPRSRRTSFISNVLVIKDALNPENEGKTVLFKYGKKIFEKITQSINPQFGEDPVNVFDFWEGANFKLKIRNYEGYRNYDLSAFDSPTALFDGDETKLEELWKKEIPLAEFVAEGNFKSETELDTKYRSLYPDQFNNVPAQSSRSLEEAASSKPKFENVSATKSSEQTAQDEDDEYNELMALLN